MKRLILIALAYNLTFYAALATKDVETRTATVNMKITPSDLISIKAKHTNLSVEVWDKNEVEVVATIRFEGKMTDRMERFLAEFQENVESKVQYAGNELSISTNLDEPNKVQIGSRHVGIVIGFSDDELRLDYQIKAPASNKYIISSSYKDVKLIGDFNEMEITHYSGDITGEGIEEANLNLKYGSAEFKRLGKVKMEIYEQEMDVDVIGDLDLNAKYSELEIKELDFLEAESYESDYVIGTVQEMSGNFKYGEIEIEQAMEKGEFILYEMEIESRKITELRLENSKYSKFNADEVSSIVFEQSYEDETEFGTLGTFRSLNSKYGNHNIKVLSGSIELNAYEDDVQIEEVMSDATRVDIDGKYINASLGISSISYSLLGNVKYGKVDYDKEDVSMTKYIKESDRLEVELQSKKKSENPLIIKVAGYEVDVKIL